MVPSGKAITQALEGGMGARASDVPYQGDHVCAFLAARRTMMALSDGQSETVEEPK